MLRWISRASFLTKVSSEMTLPTTHYNAVVVGSGLAGLTAALKLSEKGLSVALVEKTASLGGNSIKASSGINGAPTEFQDPNENDSIESFVSDTTSSGKGLSDARLVEILAGDSANAISWLSQEIGVDLSMVSRLGGHSHARTHRGKGKLPPGFAIISALTKKLKEQPNVEIMTSTRLQGFSRMDQHVTGVVLDQENEENVGHKGRIIMTDNVVLATGGFCADTSGPESLIREYRPDLQNLPSTNGQQTTGDGHRLAKFGLDAKLIQMDQIQVHPTGFVQLKDASTITSKWKFLCGELIRGIGGILLSSQNGKRFVNELSTRDTVTHAINENSGPVAIVVVSEEDYQKAASHIGFYMSQSLMFKGQAEDIIQKLTEIDPENECSKEEIMSALEDYNEGLTRQSDPLGRTHFGNAFGNTYYFGFVTPVLHFTMGGVETNEQRQIMKNDGSIIPNVYAIGELSAGVHGANRLAGSSLLECVVFGTRVADHISRRS